MRRTLAMMAALGGLLVLLGVGYAASVARSFDTPEFQKALLAEVRAALGAELKVQQMQISLLRGVALQGVTIANLCQQERKLRKAHLAWEEGGRQGDEPTKPMDDEQLRRAINEAAYGTIAFLLDMDKVLSEFDALAGDEAAATVG